MNAAVTVIVPVYNRADLLRDCLESLRRQSYTPLRVIVVDDASQEDIAACAAAAYPDAELVRRDVNGGFARAANDGLRRVDTPLAFLLNSDMTLEPDCLERLVEGMSDSRAAMTCPLVLFRDDPDTIYSAGDTILRGGRPESIGLRQPRAGFEVNRRPFGVSAGAALYSREVFDTIGLFDEKFVAYFEDADLCMRARAAGFQAACVPEAVAYHVGSASLFGNTAWRTRQCYRNHALLVLKNYPLRRLLLESPWILRERIHQTRRLLAAYRTEWGLVRAWRERLSAFTESAALVPYALNARRQSGP
jgi:hypothetical protein